MKALRLTPAVRISLGLALFTVTLLLGAEMLGFLPDPQQTILDSRKKTCESLAVYATLAIQKGDFNAVKKTLKVLKERNEDILSAALRKGNHNVLTQVGDHDRHWDNSEDKLSTRRNVQVPIYKGKVRWGTFEVCFTNLQNNVFARLWAKPVIKMMALIFPLAFVGFFLLMKKTLRHLDPSAVVPERVKLTLDSLVEGVVLMDHQERIVLSNKSFENTFNGAGENIIGRKVSDLNWKEPHSGKSADVYPWRQAMREGDQRPAVPLILQKTGDKPRTFMVNGSPIIDMKGITRGALATFDDVTHIEAQNTKLQKMLDALKKSRDEVRRQNRALHVLATQDPLTGCLNRRAFFERFEVEFNRARRFGHDMTCVMLDIDHFKGINDEHGHQVGDNVLKEVGHILRSCLQDKDVVCRYGGEEFCLLLTETGAPEGLKTAENVRRAIANQAIFDIQVTVSLGVSAMEFKPGNPSELIYQADKSLYKAKTGGRNSAIVYSEVAETEAKENSGAHVIFDRKRPTSDGHIPHSIVKALMLALEHRDVSTAEHCRKVGDLCVAAAQGLMSISECSILEIAGLLHDIGKLSVPDTILFKTGPLTREERQLMLEHKRRGLDVIASAMPSAELVEMIKYRSHWYDGSTAVDDTQPKGKEIPLGARILHIADAYDSMVSHRPYRVACSGTEAYAELRRCAGTQFDPDLVAHFIDVVNARDNVRRENTSAISNAIKLKIGYEVERLLTAVNTAAWNDLVTSAEHLTDLADQYHLNQVKTVTKKIKRAVVESSGQMEIMKLTSNLLGVCGPLKSLHDDSAGNQNKTAAA